MEETNNKTEEAEREYSLAAENKQRRKLSGGKEETIEATDAETKARAVDCGGNEATETR